MAQVSMLSDEWLSRYGLLENFNTRMAIFEGVLSIYLSLYNAIRPRGHFWQVCAVELVS